MKKNKEQRVGILIDGANMYHSAKNLYRGKVDFGKVLKSAVGGRKLIRAICYVAKSKTGEEAAFFEALENLGFELKIKEVQVFATGTKKANWDVGLTVDAIKLANKLDAIVLVTGDGDFAPLVLYLKEGQGCFVEIMAFLETTSGKLLEIVDDFTDLGDSKNGYLLAEKKKSGNKQKKSKTRK
jgi:uncharacterized protein (TIGR00288 family)